MEAEAPCETVIALHKHTTHSTAPFFIVITFRLPLTIDHCHFHVWSPAMKNSPTCLEIWFINKWRKKQNSNDKKTNITNSETVGICRDRRRKAWPGYILPNSGNYHYATSSWRLHFSFFFSSAPVGILSQRALNIYSEVSQSFHHSFQTSAGEKSLFWAVTLFLLPSTKLYP